MTPDAVLTRLRTPAALIWVVAPLLVGAVLLSATGSYLVRTVTALAAAYVLLRAARRHHDGLGLARVFFAGALLVGALSGLASAGYLAVTGHAAGTGWLADWIYLCYAPFAVLGALAVPRPTGSSGGWVRAIADGAVAAGSFWYLSLVLLIDPHQLGDNLAPAAKAITLAYPLLPAFVIAVMLSALPRVEQGARPFLTRAVGGVALLGVSDAAFSVASWNDTYDPASWIAGANELGLLMLLAAALVGARPSTAHDAGRADTDATHGALVVFAPFAPLLLALVAAVRELADGRGVPSSQVGPLILIGFAVVVRHVASARETAQLVGRLTAREQAAHVQAMTDPLTGLHNRLAFIEHLDASLRDPDQHPVAVAMLDLNDFKDINDTHGHDTGDEVLRHTADRLRHVVPTGAVARLGGDEFAAFIPASQDNGAAFAAEIASVFAQPVRVGRRQFQVRPSVGVVLDERPPGAARKGDASHLLAHADVAMYAAKSNKSVQDVPVAVLTGRARAAAAATIRLRDEISAPRLEQFRLAYQPVVDLQTGAIVGAEALLRWDHPDVGEVSPAVFVPLAERVGSVGVLGDHVLTRALDDLVRWDAQTEAHLQVGINFSPRQLTEPTLADRVVGMLADRGLDPDQLAVEVTEEALVDDIEAVVDTIAALRAAGVSVAVDDFGTGYSSLRYLRRFDANIVKIDREFVQAASTEPRTEALVRSVVSMADALDLVCVAEGIETLEQLALVRAHGCRLGQGYLLARPMPTETLGQLVAAGHVYPVDVSPPSRPAATRSGSVVPLSRAT
ncbi:MAG TPA: bifunctional diguanylate cyclase/phosphodiesterase [Actinomycetes bacterium]|nr:bifunctional diguanylate cyclase/phosphodiesterase [Actinomycetes bacterium]